MNEIDTGEVFEYCVFLVMRMKGIRDCVADMPLAGEGESFGIDLTG